jgi:hypothetical protein
MQRSLGKIFSDPIVLKTAGVSSKFKAPRRIESGQCRNVWNLKLEVGCGGISKDVPRRDFPR